VLSYGLDDRRFKSWQVLGIFLFTTASRKALGPSQPPIQWVPGALSLGVEQLGSEVCHSPPCSAEVKNAWSCIFTPPLRLHGVVLSLKKAQGQLYFTLLFFTVLQMFAANSQVGTESITKYTLTFAIPHCCPL
jgi:hypothetical protein